MERNMETGFVFSEDFLSSLGNINIYIQKILVLFIHALKSIRINTDSKIALRDDVIAIGRELNNFYISINLNKITQYDVRETEKRIIEKNNELIKEINKIDQNFRKKNEVTIDKNMLFNIQDIVQQLGSIKISNDYAITKDKIDNLFAAKKFIADIYHSQFKNTIEKEKKMDRDMYALREKTFLEVIKNSISNNPEYYFRTTELIKKLISLGKKISIEEDLEKKDTSDNIKIFPIGLSNIEYYYSFSGLSFDCNIKRSIDSERAFYEISGIIGKGLSEILYSINLKTVDNKIEQIEHVLGLDYLWLYFEKAYIELKSKNDTSSNKNETLNKTVIDKAIDELLFN
jgi:hypothetical protein